MDRSRVAENVHRELVMVLRHHDGPPQSRFGDQPELVHRVKKAIKRAISAEDEDLYDLNTWTQWTR